MGKIFARQAFWTCAIPYDMSYFLKNEREADVYINEINKGDLQKLKEKAKVETNAKQRDRYRAVVLALEGIGQLLVRVLSI